LGKFMCTMLRIYIGDNKSVIATSTLTNMWDSQRSIEARKNLLAPVSKAMTTTMFFMQAMKLVIPPFCASIQNKTPKLPLCQMLRGAENMIWNELADLIMKLVNEQ
jgi:hypothetical protein